MAPNAVATVTVEYDVSQIDFQGIYTADVLITTSAQPIAKARTDHSRVPVGCNSSKLFSRAHGNRTDGGFMPSLPQLQASAQGWLTCAHKQSSIAG